MRKVLLAAVLGLGLAGGAPGLLAAPSWSWSTSLDTIVGIGDTRYLMEIPDSPYGVSSELIFPLNTLLEGVTFRGERKGAFEVSVAVNLAAPFEKMKDYDWDMYPGYPKSIWSYTESDATMLWLVASAAWRAVLAGGSWGRLETVLKYRLQYIYQEEHGINGWQYIDGPDPDTDPDLELLDDPGVLALTYWVLWNVPSVGLAVTLRPATGVAVAMEAGLAVPHAADRDDHLLRNKLSTAAGLGIGGYAEVALKYSWGSPKDRVRPYVVLAVEAMALKANTAQTQTWYGDDPYSSYVEQPGDYISGVDHQISMKQLNVVLACGATY